jgi:LDH2 family malate/lactate/ureidoglycolate dehydrogenase
MDRVKGAKKLPGTSEILLPGERGLQKVRARQATGFMPVEANLYARLKAMAGARLLLPLLLL